MIAHEIGHFELHPDPTNEVHNVQAQLGGDLIDSGAGIVEGYSLRERKEVQADIFAGEFLCPAGWLRTELIEKERRPSAVAQELGLPYGLVLNQAIRALLLPPLREPTPQDAAPAIELDQSQLDAATWSAGRCLWTLVLEPKDTYPRSPRRACAWPGRALRIHPGAYLFQ